MATRFPLFLGFFGLMSLTAAEALDSSPLPDTIVSETKSETKEGGLLHREEIFKAGDIVLMARGTWLAEDGITIVRTAHRLLADQKDVMIVYDFNETPNHVEHHASITSFLPKDTNLIVCQADTVSPAEWRLTDLKGRVLASFIRRGDGMIIPRTRAMFDADQKEREAKLSRN